MSKLDTESVVTLIINGEQSKTTLKEVTGAVNSLRAELSNMRKEDDPALYDEKIQKLGELRDAQAAMKEEMGLTSIEAQKMAAEFKAAFAEIAGSLGIGYGISELIGFGKELFNTEVKASGVERAFTRIGDTTGLIDKLRTASRGMIADMDLQKLAVQANQFNVPLEKLPLLLAFAAERARDTGKDVSELTEKLIEGLGRKGGRSLVELGISTEEFNAELSRTPNRIDAIGNIIKRRMTEAGEDIDNLGDHVVQMQSKWENFKDWLAGAWKFITKPIPGFGSNGPDQEEVQKATNREMQNFKNLEGMKDKELETALKTQAERIKKLNDAAKAAWAAQQKELGDPESTMSTRKAALDKAKEADIALAAANNVLGVIRNTQANLVKQEEITGVEGTIKNLDIQIEDLKKHQKEVATTIDQWKADQKKIDALEKDKEKITGPSKAQEKAGESAKEKAARELKQYQEQLGSLQTQIDELIANSTKGTEKGLEAKLKVIDDKYQSIIDKIKKIDTSKFATAADHKQNAANVQAASDADIADKSALVNEAEYKGELENVKQFTEQKQALLDEQREKDQVSEEDYQKESEKLLKDSLEKQFMLELLYGENTFDTEKKLHDLEMREEQRVAEEKKKITEQKLKVDEDYLKAKKGIADAEGTLMQSGMDLATAIFGKSKALKIAELAFEKIMAVEKIKTDEQVEIAGYFKAYSGIPGGFLIATGLAAAAEVRADIEVAAVLVSGLTQAIGDLSGGGSSKGSAAKKMADGGIIEGPSHAAGGVPLINGHTGEQVAELEGGEHLAVFSKNTSANNRMMINELLYNSQYRNGAPVTVNAAGAAQAMQYYRTGTALGQFNHGTGVGSPGAVAPGAAGMDLTETNQRLANLEQHFANFSQKPWEFPHKAFEDYSNLVADTRSAANAV